jgi:pimeloyl-ACP methyl ester carboxylesterase
LADVADVVIPDLTRHDDMAALAKTVLEGLPNRFALAGLSMGGYAALEILRQAPERVARLALLDTSARADTASQARRRRGLIALSGRGRFKGVTPRLLPQLVHPSRLDDTALVDGILAMAARVGRDGFINQQKAILSRGDSRDLLPAVRCPTLIVCGREDALTPPSLAEEMAVLVPGSDLRLIEDCGHLPALERPEATTNALRGWLLS